MGKLLVAGLVIASLLGVGSAAAQGIATGPERTTGVAPVRLRVPAARIDAWIEGGAIAFGELRPPTGPWVAAWYGEAGLLGEPGNVVLAGYRDFPLIGPAAFAGLGGLAAGDAVAVTGEDGEPYGYRVTAVDVYSPQDLPVRQLLGRPSDGERLMLVTIGRGSGDEGVVVVTAERAAVARTDAGETLLRDVPAAAECRVSSRDLLEPSDVGRGTAATSPATRPTGQPIDDATTEAVTAVVRERTACVNAGDYRRPASLFSSDYLRAAFADPPPAYDDVLGFARRRPLPLGSAAQRPMSLVDDVWALADGRVVATVRPAPDDPRSTQLHPVETTFVRVSDRWQIDAEADLAVAPGG